MLWKHTHTITIRLGLADNYTRRIVPVCKVGDEFFENEKFEPIARLVYGVSLASRVQAGPIVTTCENLTYHYPGSRVIDVAEVLKFDRDFDEEKTDKISIPWEHTHTVTLRQESGTEIRLRTQKKKAEPCFGFKFYFDSRPDCRGDQDTIAVQDLLSNDYVVISDKYKNAKVISVQENLGYE